MKLGIVTINYHCEEYINSLIKDILKQDYTDWAMTIVNNQVETKDLEKIVSSFDDKRISIVEGGKNLGFAKANNLGFKYLKGKSFIGDNDIVLFMNPDIRIEDKTFLSSALESIKVLGANFLGPKIINNDQTIMSPHLKKLSFFELLFHIGSNGIVDKILNKGERFKKAKDPMRVFLINGSCMFCKASAFIEVGMFDSNTFLYHEEECLYRKAEKLDKPVYFAPNLIVYHEHSGSVRRSHDYIGKKKLVYQSELYILKKILKCNKIKVLAFKLERWLEFLLAKAIARVRR